MAQRAAHSRDSSNASARHAHAPATPSQLRQAHAPSDTSTSPEDTTHPPRYYDDDEQPSPGAASPVGHARAAAHVTPLVPAHDHAGPPVGIVEIDLEPTPRTRLLDLHTGNGDAFFPPAAHRTYGSFAGSIHSDQSFGPRSPAIHDASDGDAPAPGGATKANGPAKSRSTTWWLAERYGIKDKRMMYLQYYIPVLNWTRQYKWRYLKGDLIAAVTMASFYIPMALSYASNLAHLPPVHGLYSFALNPLIYAVLGTCPQMIVGPEAPGSLLVGEIVRENIKKGATGDNDGRRNAEIAGIITCLAGAFILIAGFFRLGFLDNVLSRPFLRGFISAIGVVIFVDQLIPQMGLARLAADQVSHGSCLDKVLFLFSNASRAHALTCAMSFTAFVVIMFFRFVAIANIYTFHLLTSAQGVQEAVTAAIPLGCIYSGSIRSRRALCPSYVEISP